jgi:hypothetical protein
MKKLTVSPQDFVEPELEIIRMKNRKIEELKQNAWKSDIDPEVYYPEGVEEIAAHLVNYERALEILHDLFRIYRNVATRLAEVNNEERIEKLENMARDKERETELKVRKLLKF